MVSCSYRRLHYPLIPGIRSWESSKKKEVCGSTNEVLDISVLVVQENANFDTAKTVFRPLDPSAAEGLLSSGRPNAYFSDALMKYPG